MVSAPDEVGLYRIKNVPDCQVMQREIHPAKLDVDEIELQQVEQSHRHKTSDSQKDFELKHSSGNDVEPWWLTEKQCRRNTLQQIERAQIPPDLSLENHEDEAEGEADKDVQQKAYLGDHLERYCSFEKV